MNVTANCPACGAKGLAAAACWEPGRRPTNEPVGTCCECGWCPHAGHKGIATCASCGRPALKRHQWTAVEHLPKPRGMTAEEFGFRAGLFVVWKTRTPSELTSQLLIFADWLQEHGRAEEVAARADWQPYGNKLKEPRGWWQWAVPGGVGWVTLDRVFHEAEWSGLDNAEYSPPGHRRVINAGRARLTKSMHNGEWFLCWPPGFVRFTAPLYHDHTRWRVTVEPKRVEHSTPSKPVERLWPGGYTTLLAPFVEPTAAVKPIEDLGLFAELAEGEAA